MKLRVILLVLALIISILLVDVNAREVYRVDKVYILKIGQIDFSTYEFLKRNLEHASNNSIILLVLDTPGGRLDAALEIVKLIQNSKTPIISYVYPHGAHAWSAGTLILLASHVATMCPGSVIGSCQPVSINIATGEYRLITDKKTLNAISKYFEETARIRGRNVTFARLCVLENLNLGAEEALKYDVIDFIAKDIDDLLEKINNTVIDNTLLAVEGDVELINIKPSISEQIYSTLHNPLLLTVLSSIGLILLILGVFTGHVYIAITGLLLMILPVLTELPSKWLGFLLIIIGAALLIVDLVTGVQSHGALSIPGFGVLIIGLLLIQPVLSPEVWSIQINPVIALVALYSSITASVIFLAIILHKVIKTVRSKPISQKLLLDLTGKIGIAVDDIDEGGVGYVKIDGEYWRVKALERIKKGDFVKILKVENNLLVVTKLRD